ncbi:MAG TPA: type IV pilus twitching motility protein PilT [Candidatus Saccharimonadales bacterium]|nr:type IV pilus twitching motility protein PilT [Candidatus Saccharimonadales bacterium]
MQPQPKIEILLEQVIKRKASDLHLQVGLPPMLRVNGALGPVPQSEPLKEDAVEQLLFSLMDEDQKKILLRDKELDFSFAFGDLGRFRVNAFHERGNLAAAMRLIPNEIPAIDQLGLPPIVANFANFPRGLVLVTGPTGSGKSTTLAALIEKINNERPAHIITVEDPIEYTHQSKKAAIVQREVHYDTYSFSAALRSTLREDPDVVLIGEMRDLETIAAAVTIAETGHLVLATLHTNSASQSIDRMIDVFPPHQQPQVKSQIGNVLQAICSQRLVPSLQGGRVPATEVLIATPAVRNIIREGKNYQLDAVIQTGTQYGMQAMDANLAALIQRGIISYDEARNFAVDVTELDRIMREEQAK